MKNIEYAISDGQHGLNISISDINDTIPSKTVTATIRYIDDNDSFKVKTIPLDSEALDSLIEYLREAQHHTNEFNEKKRREWDMRESERVE